MPGWNASGLVALELIARGEIRHLFLIRDLHTQGETESPNLLQSREIPICVVLVGRLMVVLRVELLESFIPKTGRLAPVLVSLFYGESRDAHPYHREVIATEIAALLRPWIRLDLVIEPLC